MCIIRYNPIQKIITIYVMKIIDLKVDHMYTRGHLDRQVYKHNVVSKNEATVSHCYQLISHPM
jgi:hypothetical protein